MSLNRCSDIRMDQQFQFKENVMHAIDNYTNTSQLDNIMYFLKQYNNTNNNTNTYYNQIIYQLKSIAFTDYRLDATDVMDEYESAENRISKEYTNITAITTKSIANIKNCKFIY